MPQEQKAQIALAARSDSSFNKTFQDAQKKLQELQEKTAEAGKGFNEFRDKILEIAGVTYVFDKIKESVDQIIESWGELTDMGAKVVQMEANLTGALQAQNDAMRGSTETLREHTEATERYISTRSRLSLQSKTAETQLAYQLIQLGVPTGTPLNAIMASVSRSTDVHGIYKTEAAQAYQSELTSALNRAAQTGNVKGLAHYGYNTQGLGLNRKAKGQHEVGSAGWLQNLAILTNAINAQDKDKKVDERIKKLADANKKWEELQEKFADVALTISADFAEVMTPFLEEFAPDFTRFCDSLKSVAAELMRELRPSIPIIEQWGHAVTKWISDFFAPSHKTWLPGGSFEALKNKPQQGGMFFQILDQIKKHWQLLLISVAGIGATTVAAMVVPLAAHTLAMAAHTAALWKASGLSVLGTGAKGLGLLAGAGIVGAEIFGGIQGSRYLNTPAGKKDYADQERARFYPWETQSQHDDAVKKQLENKDAVAKTTDALNNMSDSVKGLGDWLSGNTSGGGTPGGGRGSTSAFTQYGPTIDPIGSPYYDKDSYKGLGHINGVPYNLNSETPGVPTAMMNAYAEGHYHIQPGGWYTSDKDGKRHRWMDTTGSKNPQNEDVYMHSRGGIFGTPHFGVVAEKGAEAIIPLTGDRNRSWGVLGAAMQALGVRGSGGAGPVIHFGGFNVNVTGATEGNAGSLATTIGEMAMEYIRDQISTEKSRLLPV